MDKTIASLFHEKSLSFNVADSSSFVLMIEESMRFAKQTLVKVTKPLPSNNYLGSSFAQYAGQLRNLQLPFLQLLKSLDLLAISEH